MNIVIYFRIKITFNVNHTVDTDPEPEVNPNADKPEIGELKSKPAFRVELSRGNTTVSLFCSFVNPGEDAEYSKFRFTVFCFYFHDLSCFR